MACEKVSLQKNSVIVCPVPVAPVPVPIFKTEQNRNTNMANHSISKPPA